LILKTAIGGPQKGSKTAKEDPDIHEIRRLVDGIWRSGLHQARSGWHPACRYRGGGPGAFSSGETPDLHRHKASLMQPCLALHNVDFLCLLRFFAAKPLFQG
jgi:hypothetical protein